MNHLRIRNLQDYLLIHTNYIFPDMVTVENLYWGYLLLILYIDNVINAIKWHFLVILSDVQLLNWNVNLHITEAVTGGVLWKKVFFKISQNSQESTYSRVSFFNKVAGLRPATLLKKKLWHRNFPVILRNFLEHLFYGTNPDDCFWHKLWSWTLDVINLVKRTVCNLQTRVR